MRFFPFFLRFSAVAATLCLLSGVLGWNRYRHRPRPLPDLSGRTLLARVLLDAANGIRTPFDPSELPGNYPGNLSIHGYYQGKPVWRCEQSATPLGAAVAACSEQLLADPPLDGTRLRVDLVRSVAPVLDIPVLRSLSFLPGLEALRVNLDNGRSIVLLPEDMFRQRLFDRFMPFSFIDELLIGMDFGLIARETRSGTGFGVESFQREQLWSVLLDDSVPDKYRAVYRGHLGPPKVTPESILAGAMAGGKYMVNALIRNSRERFPCDQKACPKGFFTAEEGQFLYNYHLVSGTYDYQSRPIYNEVRHAGTTYALANLYLLTQEPVFRDAASRAIAYLVKLAGDSCVDEPFRCVATDDEPCLGSASLTLLAAAEYRLASDDDTYDGFARDLAKFILFMQRPDGSFRHVYHLKTRTPDEKEVLLFYSGEAAFALARAWRAFGNPEYLKAAVRGLDHLVGPAAAPLPFHFGFGEEHWTCMAAREVAPEVKKRRYLDFCLNYSRFLERQQFTETDTAFRDFSGSYGFSPFLPPHTNGAGSRTESNVSILELARIHGVNADFVERQIRRSLEHILMHQKRPDNCWICDPNPRMEGAIVNTLSTWEVRIDTVQHTTTGLIRAYKALYP